MKIVVEQSGGADSMVAALEAKRLFPDAKLYGFMVNYGQAPFSIEYEKAKAFCEKNFIELKIITIKDLFSEGTVKGEESAEETGIAKIYTPLRNLVIGACAASYAESIGAELIISGSKGLNDDGKPYSFRDSLLPFYELMTAVLNYASYKSIKMMPILTHHKNSKMSKLEVYKYLEDNSYGIDDFWNCFNAGPERCHKCNNCKELDNMIDNGELKWIK